MIAAVSLTALGVVAFTVGYAFYNTRRKDKAYDQALVAVRVNAQLLVQVDDLEDGIADRDKTIEQLTAELEGEKAARWKVEEQRDALLQKLADGGDVFAVAAAIRDELSALSELSRVPDDPDASTEGN